MKIRFGKPETLKQVEARKAAAQAARDEHEQHKQAYQYDEAVNEGFAIVRAPRRLRVGAA